MFFSSRKRNNSCRRIQSKWRSFTARSRQRRALRDGWDASLAKMTQLETILQQQTGKSACLVDISLNLFIRQLLFFYRPSEDPKDRNRLAQQCLHILANVGRASNPDSPQKEHLYDLFILKSRFGPTTYQIHTAS